MQTLDILKKYNLSTLIEANLSGADLSRADLSGADLSDSNLFRANLSGANLSGANLSYSNLFRAHLSRADLSGAYFSDSNLFRANLSGANLSRAELSGANLSETKGIVLFQYNRHCAVFFRYCNESWIKIGCHTHSVDFWIENYRVVGKKEKYTAEEIAEYGSFIKHVNRLKFKAKE